MPAKKADRVLVSTTLQTVVPEKIPIDGLAEAKRHSPRISTHVENPNNLRAVFVFIVQLTHASSTRHIVRWES